MNGPSLPELFPLQNATPNGENKLPYPEKPDFREKLQLVDPELVKILRSRERQARILMEKRHGIISPGLGYKSYHGEDPEIPGDEQETGGEEHPKGEGHINRVAERAVLIMETFLDAKKKPQSDEEAKERQEMLVFAHYIGQIHDLVQKYKLVLVTTENGEEVEKNIQESDWKKHIGKGKRILRKRTVDENENETIDAELKFMDEENKKRTQQNLPNLFTDKHKNWVRRALLATIPGWDKTGSTVYQPQLKWEDGSNNELTYATAWADLKGGIFMDGWEQFFKESDLNLLEDNPDIQEVILNSEKYPDMTNDVVQRIRIWRGSMQVSFARAQWEQLPKQTKLFPDAEPLLRERHFRQETYNETYQKVVERGKNDKTRQAEELFDELKERILQERTKYPQAA